MNIYEYQRLIRASDLPYHLKGFFVLLTTWSTGNQWDIHPKNGNAAAELGCSPETFRRNIRELKSLGWISVQSVDGFRKINLETPENGFSGWSPVTTLFTSDHPVHTWTPCPPVTTPPVTSDHPSYIRKEETIEETKKRSVASRARGEHTLRNATPAFNSQEGESVKVHGVSGLQNEQSQDSAQETPQEIWAQLWGRQAYPRCLAGRERGVALDVIAWLLVKRRESPDGITSPGRLAKYILGDYEQGTKTPYAHWTPETLSKLKEGLSYAMARKESETAREGQVKASKRKDRPASYADLPENQIRVLGEEERKRVAERMRRDYMLIALGADPGDVADGKISHSGVVFGGVS